MKNFKLFVKLLPIMLLLAGMCFGNVPKTHAQADQTWSDPINLSRSGASTKPSMVIDAQGALHVIWVDEFDGYKYVRSADGVTWTSPVSVNFPFSPLDDPQLVLLPDVSGEIHILWQYASGSLFYSRALPGRLGEPSTWVGTIRLSDSVVGFSAVTGSRGVVYLGFATNLATDLGPAGVYYRRLSSSNWSNAVGLYTSQYFRSLEPADANVKVAVSVETNQVYLTWDDRPQKRIFMTRSTDGGSRWESATQILGPEESTGLELPYNIHVGVVGGRPLLLWQIGIPGSYCIIYSQRSLEDGLNFEPPVKIGNEFTGCPRQTEFLLQDQALSIVLMNLQDDVSLLAWNGSDWSNAQTPNELSTFINPATFDNVFFGCQQAAIHDGKLFVVGCDIGGGGDIWLRSRSLGALEDWFPPPSAWTVPTVLASATQEISAVTSVRDAANSVLTFWVEAPLPDAAVGNATIQYANWNSVWSEPRAILSGFAEIPSKLSAAMDQEGRVLLSWVEGKNGDIYFSWADAERAYIASEWSQPIRVPTSSPLGSSPSILVDDAGKVVVVYAVPLNENRGIYTIQTDDLGKTWSQPVSVVNAVERNWDSVDKPLIELSADGQLHVLFNRFSLREAGKSEGLYYSQSSDGGGTWSQPQAVTEQSVQWSRMVYLNDQTLHLAWQERPGRGSIIFHQFSQDGGLDWGNPVSISNLPDDSVQASLVTDGGGHIHVILSRLEGERLVFQVLTWDGSQWLAQPGRELEFQDAITQYSISAEVTSQGILHVLVSLIHINQTGEMEYEIVGFHRSLGESSIGQSRLPLLLPELPAASDPSGAVEILPTSTAPSPLENLVITTPPSRKNFYGLLLVGGAVVAILIFFWPGRKKRP